MHLILPVIELNENRQKGERPGGRGRALGAYQDLVSYETVNVRPYNALAASGPPHGFVVSSPGHAQRTWGDGIDNKHVTMAPTFFKPTLWLLQRTKLGCTLIVPSIVKACSHQALSHAEPRTSSSLP
jgi:hypothetical protein